MNRSYDECIDRCHNKFFGYVMRPNASVCPDLFVYIRYVTTYIAQLVCKIEFQIVVFRLKPSWKWNNDIPLKYIVHVYLRRKYVIVGDYWKLLLELGVSLRCVVGWFTSNIWQYITESLFCLIICYVHNTIISWNFSAPLASLKWKVLFGLVAVHCSNLPSASSNDLIPQLSFCA